MKWVFMWLALTGSAMAQSAVMPLGVGNVGPIGPIGPVGPTGTQGPKGDTGPQGPAGPAGNAGATGPQGPQGTIGATGPQGSIGLQGATGATGQQGPVGATGQTGAQGPAGSQGATGATGPTGPQGPAGVGVNSLTSSTLTQYGVASLFTATSDTVVAATTATSIFGPGIGSRTIPANALAVGTKFRITFRGNYTTPTANVATTSEALKLGSTVVSSVTSLALTALANKYPLSGELVCTVRGIGATGAMMCNGSVLFATALVGGALTVFDMSTPSPVTINTTVANTLDVTMLWSTIAGSQTATITQSSLEVLN